MLKLVHKVCPDVDFSSQLGPPVIRDSWKSDFPNSSASSSRKASPSAYPSGSVSQHSGLSPNPTNVIDLSSAISFHHRKHSGVTDSSFDSLSDAEESDGGRPLTLVQEIGLPSLHPVPSDNPHSRQSSIDLAFQYTGRSSNYHLANQLRRVKGDYQVEARHGSADRSDEDDVDMQDRSVSTRRNEFWTRPPVCRNFIWIHSPFNKLTSSVYQ